MSDDFEHNTEAKRLAIDVIANVAWYRRDLIEKILLPAGVPSDMCRDHLYRIDEITNKKVTKRNAAPHILEEMEQRGEGPVFVRKVIEIGAKWSDFHLHEREMEARATVEKAKAYLRQLEGWEAQERDRQERQRRQEQERQRKEQEEQFQRERQLLLMQFDELYRHENPQVRGTLLEDFLNRYFALFKVPSIGSFRRNMGGEQIDGAFRWGDWHYLVECKWTSKLSGIQELDGLNGKIGRGGKATMGMFLSISGWSEHVPTLLKQNAEKNIILADGYDLRFALESTVSFRTILEKKIEALNLL